jgi:GTP-binding protein
MTPKFLTSAAQPAGFPPESGTEVAVVGRSNSGKSSAINRIVGVRKLARVSKTPGRTQLINFFELADDKRLVDLPGYGFAKVPEAIRRQWESLIGSYFEDRRSLVGLIVTVDIRRGFRDLDFAMFGWAEAIGVPVLALLTKADKLSRGAGLRERDRLRLEAPGHVEPLVFSATSGAGADEARARLATWLGLSVPVRDSPPRKPAAGSGEKPGKNAPGAGFRGHARGE